jgi:Dolichyl-phosphate-mannose-protein mannosyltransferase
LSLNRILTRDIVHSSNFLLALALGLSSFTFLWNPLEYPPLIFEDGTYVGRAMRVLSAHDLQEETLYDHPYFGQLFLAGILWMLDYPDSIHVSADGDVVRSVEKLWLVPKIFIGILGVIDTFLIYKISELRYNTKIAFIASILFAVMTISLLRSMYLESIQLPFLLSSILFAVSAKGCRIRNNEKKKLSMILLSGIFMGLAIFTKVPVFTMIPLVVFLISPNNYKNMRMVSLWLIPVVLIPLIWPGYAISHGEFDHWWNRLYWQTHRQTAGTPLEEDRQHTLTNSITKNLLIMPVLMVLGLAGLVFAALKKDFFLLLWAIPFLVFLYFIGFVSQFHIIPLLPLLCISSARFIVGLTDMITYRKIGEVLPFFIIAGIATFGLINVMTQFTIHHNDNENKFLTAAFVTRYLRDNNDDNITMISNHLYSWIPKYVFQLGKDYNYMIPEIKPIEIKKDKKVLLVVDPAFKGIMSGNDEPGERLRKMYSVHSKNGTTSVEVGRDKIILPEAHSSYNGSIRDNGTNLLSSENNWTLKGKGRLFHADGSLKILVKTNGTDKVSRNAILRTQLNNVTETPLLLSLSYASKSPEGNDKFSVEIKDTDSQKRYFKSPLMDTSGNETSQLFILPGEIVGKATEFRFGLTTITPSEHMLVLKKVRILY